MDNFEEQGEAGSFFGSESEQGQESQHAVEQGPGVGAADSVNNGPQSPRIPRSQISRAHPGQATGYAERTSAVLSVLSGDDETALSAAEAAGEHTSHPNGNLAVVAQKGAGSRATLHLPSNKKRQRRQVQAAIANILAEDHFSPPDSTSPIYRANSVVSHTAAPVRGSSARRPAETPMSAPTLPGIMVGASPTTSRVEYSRLPFGLGHHSVRSHASRPQQQQQPQDSVRLMQQQQQQQHSNAAAGPSYASISVPPQLASSSHAAPLPSTLGMVTGVPSTPIFLPPPAAVPSAAIPVSTPPQPANLAAWVRLAASMGVPLEVLQAQSSVLQQGQQAGQAPLQQAEALQSMAAALQAQASVILQQQQQQRQAQRSGVDNLLAASSSPIPFLLPLAAMRRQELPQNAVIEASGPGGSMYSIPDLVGASEIQGHPLPPPFLTPMVGTAGAAAAAPTLASGITVPLAAPEAGGTPPQGQQQSIERAAGSSHREGSGNRGSASPGAMVGRRRGAGLQYQSAPAQASSMVHGHDRPPRAARPAGVAGAGAVSEPVGPAVHHGHRGAGEGEAGHGIPSTDAAAIGGVVGEEAGNDGLEVQQAAPLLAVQGFPAAQPAGLDTADTPQQHVQQDAALSPAVLPPAPHGAASVMATLVSSGQQSDVESEISAPHSHPAHGHLHSPLPSMQPALATANTHMGVSYMAATASQQHPRQQAQQAYSAQGQSPQAQGGAGSRLATVETGGMEDDAAGGSVDMAALATGELPPPQRATSAPPRDMQEQPGSPGGKKGGVGGPPGLGGPSAMPRQHHPTASAPTVLPGQEAESGGRRPAASASLSAHCNDVGATGDFAEHNPCAPQAQSSAFVFKRQQRTSGWGEHTTSSLAGQPLLAEEDAMMEERRAGQPPGQGASPQGSMFHAPPGASEGTARGTILAGQAHSILTTAAAGDGQQGGEDEEGEALSPLVLGRLPPPQAAASDKPAGSHAGGSGAAWPAAHDSPRGGGSQRSHRGAVEAPPPPRSPTGDPLDFSTVAQDVGGATAGLSAHEPMLEPEPTLLSGQPPSAAHSGLQRGEVHGWGSPPPPSVGEAGLQPTLKRRRTGRSS